VPSSRRPLSALLDSQMIEAAARQQGQDAP
jgi:hypothetical protein